ncbi:hypothetical protein PACTADRAFT_49695 [Pachysolen tannophilus NRRL Y-2460]|uniref:Chromatin structure-remodeling complex subunit SFH1 n=1 Tax=Pachysolen tannophilus NRRL Y-2460 TaxID=669874 RepID=A0A1E4TX47_PACTA|nr:hypothetical protein PACTADRAFT_49695 [Pachysolen tannophilus NRRL Y-2460]
MAEVEKPTFPQALTTSFPSRLKNENTALFITLNTGRNTKRNATHVVNYAEFDNDFFDDNDNDQDFVLENASSSLPQQNNLDLSNFEGKLATMTKHLEYNENDLIYNASLPEILIPIRISLDYQTNKITDFFMWNINETLMTPENFAIITCNDLELPNSYANQISNSIRQQVEEYQNLASIPLPEGETHVIINLSVNLDKQFYEDKFEWDLANSQLLPEDFAETVARDLGLSLEFKAAIAHSLHETLLKLKKEFIENNQLTLLQQYDISKLNFCYQTTSNAYGISYDQQGLRYDTKNFGSDWSPAVETLSQWEIEKREIERERNIRRLKRETMRIGDDYGGPTKRRYRRRLDELDGSYRKN